MPAPDKKGRDPIPAFLRLKQSRKLSACARQRMHPALHTALGVLNVFVAKPIFKIDSLDGINRPHEIALVTERYGGVDAHAAFETGI